VPILTNSERHIYKATHTSVELPQRGRQPARALEKAAFIRGLQLQHGEVRAVVRALDERERERIPREVLGVLEGFELHDAAGTAPGLGAIASVPPEVLRAFGQAVVDVRTERVAEIRRNGAARTQDQQQLLRRSGAALDLTMQAAKAGSLLSFAHASLHAFTQAIKISPIGMLHLERLEMTPIGVERGELLGTVPLAPKETTSVRQKEWAVTDQEFSSIVTDYLENYSERGVAEKSEMAAATESQTRHSQQLGLGATVSGSYGFVSFSTSTTFNTASSADESVRVSRKQASDIISKASARVRKERKVTIESRSTTGSEEETTRTLTNPSDTDSMRIDYYSMMRKWRVRLLQYGLRMTYDIAIPEPGATLRGPLVEIAQLEAKMAVPFAFALKAGDITPLNYQDHAATWGASVPPPPQPIINQRIGGPVHGLGEVGEDTDWHFNELEVVVPDGYQISGVWLDAMLGNVGNDPENRMFAVFGYGAPPGLGTNGKASFVENLSGQQGFLIGRTGRQKIVHFIHHIDTAAVTFVFDFSPTDPSLAAWRFDVWQRLHDAARDAYYTSLQTLGVQRDNLRQKLADVDTLTLRQEEREEVMKGVLRWLLGPEFDFMPDDVEALFTGTGVPFGTSFTSNELGIDAKGWATMFRFQEMVKFLQQAIEWENLLYFLYPYFWDVPSAWNFVRTIRHPDPNRQQFLRAGSARVVLTIRPGYEQAFAAFVDQGNFGEILPPDHPYLTIGQEIQAYDRANYPGIPPANAEGAARPLIHPLQRRAWREMQGIIALLEKYRAGQGAYPTSAQGLAALSGVGAVPAGDPWGRPYVYTSPGSVNDYEVSTLGKDGAASGDGENADITSWAPASLIAEWFDYTPSRGVDVQVNTALSALA
jgi:hypothetical protein